MQISLVGLHFRSIGEIADALREPARKLHRLNDHAAFPHGVSMLSDSRSLPG
jgi:hypothetical protein